MAPGTSACVSTACTPGSASAAAMSIETMRACACGLRSVAPCNIPGTLRSLEYANSPLTLGTPSGRSTISPMRPRTSCVVLTRATPPRPGVRPRRCARSRCNGRGCPTAPRGCRPRSATGRCSSSATVATTRPGVQKPHCTAPAATNARCTACSRPSVASPSTVTTSRPSACAPCTRQAHTSCPSRSTEQEPHSPSSQAPLAPGRSSRSRSTNSRLSAPWTSASRRSPLTRSSILIRGTSRVRGA